MGDTSAVNRNEEAEERLKTIYYNPAHPSALGSAPVLARAANVPLKRTQDWLRKQETYTLHRNARRHYPTRQYYVNTIDEQWQMDLADMNQVRRQNRNVRYILTCIDILSRYGWARPVKTKSGTDVAAAIQDIFREGRIPKRIQTDQGKEFYNAHVKRLLEANNVELFSVKSPFKSAIVERWNRTIKTKMWKLFTSKNNYKWLDDLPKIVDAYNHAKHRTIGMQPANVTQENAMIVWERLYGGRNNRNKKKSMKDITTGDTVRISKAKGQFEKGYLPNWSREEFIVHDMNKKFRPAMVSLKDERGEIIEGKFYEDEIQRIIRDDDIFKVEKIVRQKRYNGEIWYLVKWLGYDESFNSWIRKRDVVQTYNTDSD